MPEFGEAVSISMSLAGQKRCAVCGRNHKAPKKASKAEKVAGTDGWTRTSLSSARATPSELHPGGPAPAGYEVHHCLVFSAFCTQRRGELVDFIGPLNRALKREGFTPNEETNLIALPGRGHEEGSYGCFWRSIDDRKPLQMHLGGHEAPAMAAPKVMLVYIAAYLADRRGVCEDNDDTTMDGKALRLTRHAEDAAFTKALRYAAPFRLHGAKHGFACKQYLANEACPDPTTRRHRSVAGHGGRAGKKPRWQAVDALGVGDEQTLLDVLERRWSAERGVMRRGNPFAKTEFTE